MDFNATIDLIIKDLNEAREIIDDLKRYPGVPLLQIELAKAKCKSAGEIIALLKTLRDTLPQATEPSEEARQFIKPQVHEEVMDQRVTSANSIPEEKQETKIKHEEYSSFKEEKAPAQVSALENSPVNEIIEGTANNIKKTGESSIIADKFSHLSSRFNEQLGSRNNEDFSGIMSSRPLSNLPDAIGINDKFLFIREIFGNNKEAYIQAISRLERSENLADARAVIMSYTGESDESEAVKQLLDLVKRKLLSHE